MTKGIINPIGIFIVLWRRDGKTAIYTEKWYKDTSLKNSGHDLGKKEQEQQSYVSLEGAFVQKGFKV